MFGRAVLLVAACGCLSAQPRNGNEDAVRAMGAIPLKDYAPDSSLIVPEHHPPKARYAAIDVHSHAYVKTPQEVAAWVRTMDQVGVETTVVLSGATGAEFDRLADLFLKAHPGRFQLYCGLETKGIEASDYPQRGAQLPRAKRLHPDDPRLSLWRPPDNHQERSPSHQRYNQYGHDVPSYAEILGMRDRLVDSQPGTTFLRSQLRAGPPAPNGREVSGAISRPGLVRNRYGHLEKIYRANALKVLNWQP